MTTYRSHASVPKRLLSRGLQQRTAVAHQVVATTLGVPAPTCPTIVIGSGKGGVGKSVIAALVAAKLSADGSRVLLVEGDQNLANLPMLLGVQPAGPLETLLDGGGNPARLVVPVRDGMWLLPGDSGAESLHGATPIERARLHYRLSGVFPDYDAVVVDGGAGIESVLRLCTIAATGLLLVTVPEPAAISNAYAVLKLVTYQMPSFPVDVVVNRASETEARTAFDKLQGESSRLLDRELEFLGAIPDDEQIGRTIRGARALLDGASDGAAAEAVAAVIARWKALRLPSPDTAITAVRS